MLIGEYRHNIDAKKRIAIPAKFRKEIGGKAVITKGQEKCLFVYPIGEWEKVAEKLSQLPTGSADNRNFLRVLLSGAAEVEIDALGRILVPDYLKEFADLREKVVIAGLYKKLEIWNEANWNDYKAKIENQADALAEKLGELGVY
ncbi:division/cell wall cluster transcriptional repressor MraZ [Candidatus Parcubacteria bacterium]|nr:MAG: division/cell wall cluster transcriptional repressor MraZ [Candidatus Parcubacteria bacterium]